MAEKTVHPIFNRDNEVGALWSKTSANGFEFLSGSVKIGGKDYPIILSKNKWKKEGDNAPDYRIYNQLKTTQAAQAAPAKPAPKKATAPKAVQAPAVSVVEEEDPLL